MIFCARATRGLRRPSLDARSERQSGLSLLKGDKRPQTDAREQATILLARRAPTMKRWSLDARSEGRFACSL
jgi:hypothetical protein